MGLMFLWMFRGILRWMLGGTRRLTGLRCGGCGSHLLSLRLLTVLLNWRGLPRGRLLARRRCFALGCDFTLRCRLARCFALGRDFALRCRLARCFALGRDFALRCRLARRRWFALGCRFARLGID